MRKPTTMTKPTIMLADDDEVYLHDTRDFLKDRYEVVLATTVEEARRHLANTPMAVALIDIQMDPRNDRDKSGLALAKETIDSVAVPKVIVTGHEDFRYAQEALVPRPDGKAPAVDVLLKTQGYEALVASIEKNIYRARVFLSYAHSDRDSVDLLYKQLAEAGFVPWMDKAAIAGGSRWWLTIEREIRGSDFFVLCLSKKSARRRGILRREIETAMQVWEGMLRDDIYLIPVRLEECGVVDERLRELQWVDMFDEHGFRVNHEGFQRLVEALRTGVIKRLLADED